MGTPATPPTGAPTYQTGSPGISGALVDFLNAIIGRHPPAPPAPDALGSGMAANAGKAISGRGKQVDQAVEDASR